MKSDQREFQKFSYQPPREWEKTFDDMVTTPFTKSIAGMMVSYLGNLHMIQNFLYNNGIYIITAPLVIFPMLNILPGMFAASLILFVMVSKSFFFAMIRLIFT